MILPEENETEREFVSRCLSSQEGKKKFPDVDERMEAYIGLFRATQEQTELD